MTFSIVLKHINGERKTVPVEYVSPNLTYLTIRWDLAGLYDLNLTVNVLTPRSAPGQSKGKAKWYKKDKPQWKAEDLATLRKMASDYLKAKRGNPADETAAAVKRHVESMPEQTNPRIGGGRHFSDGRAMVADITHAKLANEEVVPIRGVAVEFKGPKNFES
jgi:hypothetical protein